MGRGEPPSILFCSDAAFLRSTDRSRPVEDEPDPLRNGRTRQFHQRVAEFEIGESHRFVGAYGDLPALPALFVGTEYGFPWRRDEDAGVVAQPPRLFLHPIGDIQPFEPQIADGIGKATVEEHGPFARLRPTV